MFAQHVAIVRPPAVTNSHGGVGMISASGAHSPPAPHSPFVVHRSPREAASPMTQTRFWWTNVRSSRWASVRARSVMSTDMQSKASSQNIRSSGSNAKTAMASPSVTRSMTGSRLPVSDSVITTAVVSERQPGGNSTRTLPSGDSTVPPPGPTVSDAELHSTGVHAAPGRNVPEQVAAVPGVHPPYVQQAPGAPGVPIDAVQVLPTTIETSPSVTSNSCVSRSIGCRSGTDPASPGGDRYAHGCKHGTENGRG